MPKYLLITGKIAEHSLHKVAEKIAGLEIEIVALNCTVASLMSTEFIARELKKNAELQKERVIVIPGLCQGPLEPIKEASDCQVLRGPKDLKDLPAFFERDLKDKKNVFSQQCNSPVRIVAEIVNAFQMNTKDILERALYFKNNGADIIDLGGCVDQPFFGLEQVIKTLKSEGFKVSIDSHQSEDILAANRAGVDLVLSLSSHNLEIAKVLNCPVVVIPDDGENLNSLLANIEKLEQWQVPYIADPILPPLTMGLAEGIGRYLQIRKEFSECEMLMGVGNVTELIDADSTGINALLVGIAGELGINYILTTEVSHRAQGAVREISLARQLIQQALEEERVPKRVDGNLLTIKDADANSFTQEELRQMQNVIRDKNYRIFVADKIYIFNSKNFHAGISAQELFNKLDIQDPKHAFYLGRELEKAELALKLKKKYVQDNPLDWGYFNRLKEERSRLYDP